MGVINGADSDRSWLENSILDFTTSKTKGLRYVKDVVLYAKFAPQSEFGIKDLISERPTYGRRKRRLQREMLEAAISRLIKAGRIESLELRKVGREFKSVDLLDALANAINGC